MRTVSPYFSSKKASAPASIASAIGRKGDAHRAVLADDPADLVLDRPLLVVGEGAVEGVVEAEIVGRDERPGLLRRRAGDVAQGAVEEVRGGVVAHRPGAPLGVDDGRDGLTDPQPPVERSAMDDEAAGRALGVLHGEERRAAAGLRELAAVADLAAALGVERRPVQDHLGLAVAGQLVVGDAVADDRDDGRLGRRRLVAEEGRVAGAPEDRLVERQQLGVAGQLGLAAAAAPLALLGEGGLEARPVDAHAVLGRQLDRQVDREAVRVVELEGDVAGEDRGVGRDVLGPPADDPLGVRERDERLLEVDRSRVERPGELGLLAGDRGQDPLALLAQVRVRVAP